MSEKGSARAGLRKSECRPLRDYGIRRIEMVFFSLLSSPYWERQTSMRIDSVDEQVRHLCARALDAEESELHAILAELRFLLQLHSEKVRYLAFHSLRSTRLRGREGATSSPNSFTTQ